MGGHARILGHAQMPTAGCGNLRLRDSFHDATHMWDVVSTVCGKGDGFALELGSARTRSWRTASNGFAELRKAIQNSAKP